MWFRVDDNFHDHPKAVYAGNAALGLWARCGSWSCKYLTNGFVPSEIVRSFGGTRAHTKRLTTIAPGQTEPLWHEVEGGFQFHDWHHRQMDAEEYKVERDRIARIRAEVGRKGGQAKARNAKQAPSKPPSKRPSKNVAPNPNPITTTTPLPPFSPKRARKHEEEEQ